jgi:hypothetical protein
MSYHPISEQIVDVLVTKTQSSDRHFFRILVAYYFSKVASMMRTNIKTHDRGVIPVNLYALNLASSGFGKNLSQNLVETHVLKGFKTKFLDHTFPLLAEQHLKKLASIRGNKTGQDPDVLIEDLENEFKRTGAMAFSFDSGTVPAIKQMRHKLLLANCGSVCFEGDEVGSNFMNNIDVLNAFLELYDIGQIKQKLLKNTMDNTRDEEIDGRTPTNMMLFGTPSKLLNGQKLEEEFYNILETGYARRLFFGFSKVSKDRNTRATAEEFYERIVNGQNEDTLIPVSDQFKDLASVKHFNKTLTMEKEVAIQNMQYRLDCEARAEREFKDHQEIAIAEMSHRHYKCLKLAGAYAFVDGSDEITEDHLDFAQTLTEDSGKAFHQMLARDKAWVRLAKYLADVGAEVTHADLLEDLPLYKGTEAQKRDLMTLAIAYGYKNNIIIKRTIVDGIEFFKGETLQETDLDKLTLAYSKEFTSNYKNDHAPFDQLHLLTGAEGIHYTAHHFSQGYRSKDNLIQGFNLAILDVDDGTDIETAASLLEDYTFLIATTKRHTEKANRFRIILPLSHTVHLDPKGYSNFMENLFNWLPFKVDSQTKDCARKWESYNGGTYQYNHGIMLDATLFIPQTKKAENEKHFIDEHSNLTHLEKWFAKNIQEGNRSNMLIRYGFALIDKGYDLNTCQDSVMNFNKKLPSPLPDEEVLATVAISLGKKYHEKHN